MRPDYSDDVGRRQGRPCFRRALALPAVCAAALLLLAGCGEESGTTAPGTIEEAYRSAHPSSARPSALATEPASMSATADRLRSDLPADVPVFLPRRLPSGWGLAAPYIAVGDGSALPNPETWPNGYRAAFTDGSALVIVSVNPGRLAGKGAWTALDLRIEGRAVAWREDGETTVLATRPSKSWRVAVIGVGTSRSLLEDVAASLSSWRTRGE